MSHQVHLASPCMRPARRWAPALLIVVAATVQCSLAGAARASSSSLLMNSRRRSRSRSLTWMYVLPTGESLNRGIYSNDAESAGARDQLDPMSKGSRHGCGHPVAYAS